MTLMVPDPSIHPLCRTPRALSAMAKASGSCKIIVVAGKGTPEVRAKAPCSTPNAITRAPHMRPQNPHAPTPSPPIGLQLGVLESLPEGAQVVGIGQTPEDFSSFSDEDWGIIDVLLNCGVGPRAGTRAHIQVSRRWWLAVCAMGG